MRCGLTTQQSRESSEDRERQAERGMYDRGVSRTRDAEARARRRGKGGSLPGPRQQTSLKAIGAVASGLVAWLQKRRHTRGPKPIAYHKLNVYPLGAEEIALIALRACFDAVLTPDGPVVDQAACLTIGGALELQAMMAAIKARRYRRWRKWEWETKARVGDVCLSIILATTKLFKRARGRKGMIEICPVEIGRGTIRPFRLPMVSRPKPWRSVRGGGYLELPMPLIRARHDDQLDITRSDCPDVFRAVNHLQNVPWRINRRILQVAKKLAPLPADLAGKSAKAKRSVRRQIKALLAQADQFVAEERFWLPVQLDFRGRVGYAPYLNPQGPKVVRACLEFADPLPLNKTGVGALAIRGSRLRWGTTHSGVEGALQVALFDETIARNVAADPFKCTLWQQAKEPWLFLRWCFEWAEALDHGDGFPTRLPCYADATASGLQHLALLLRDQRTAEAVNLRAPIDALDDFFGRPTDVYAIVAERLRASLESVGGSRAAEWLRYGIDRNVVKAPIMTLPYGSTPYGRVRQIKAAIGDRIGEFEDLHAAAVWLEPRLADTIRRALEKPCELLDALQRMAETLARLGRHAEWDAPSGFRVRQREFHQQRKSLKLAIGERVFLRPTKDLSPRDARQAIAANLIHSLDAAHLARTIAKLARHRIAVATIHDCYATHANHVPAARQALLESLVEMYRPDWLGAYHKSWSAGLRIAPMLPKPGDLDVAQCLG